MDFSHSQRVPQTLVARGRTAIGFLPPERYICYPFFNTVVNQKYTEYEKLDLSAIGSRILARWEEEDTFRRSIAEGKMRLRFLL